MNRERRAVLRGIAAATGVAFGSGAVVGRNGARTHESDARDAERADRPARQQVDTSLPPGVTLFDLNDDGTYTATVESGPDVADDAHPRPIHVTSNGNSTVDYAASIAEPSAETTLGGLGELAYDYYEGPNNTNESGSGRAPDTTFVVVENDDGRHGMYLTADDGTDPPGEQWTTFDVLTRLRGGGGWYEYTEVESGYEGQQFGDAVERFGEDARLVRVGVGRGDAVTPTTLDVYYDNLVVDGRSSRFPTSVAKRVAQASPF